MAGFDNPIHIVFIVIVLLLVFGAKRLPEIGRSLGSGMRGFKDSLTGAGEGATPPAAQPALGAGPPSAPPLAPAPAIAPAAEPAAVAELHRAPEPPPPSAA